MSTVLEAIRSELAMLRLRLSCLEQTEELLGPLYDPTWPMEPITAKPSTSRKAPSRPQSVDPTREQLHEYIVAHGPVANHEIVAALGGNPRRVNDKIRRLVANGQIAAAGGRGERRYRAPEVVIPVASGVSGRASQLEIPPRGTYPMYDAIIDLDGATTEQLCKQTGLPASAVVEQGRRLMQRGLVRFTDVDDARVWLPAQSELLRDAA
jgi:hypothetical protein